jgi:uncharacterized ubiquitin-like protein YukD
LNFEQHYNKYKGIVYNLALNYVQNIEDAVVEKTIRKVDPNDILLVSKEKFNDYTMTDKEY